jgi:hypothetical protein
VAEANYTFFCEDCRAVVIQPGTTKRIAYYGDIQMLNPPDFFKSISITAKMSELPNPVLEHRNVDEYTWRKVEHANNVDFTLVVKEEEFKTIAQRQGGKKGKD